MDDILEKVIELPQIVKTKEESKITTITNEIINMFFEVFISFVPIILYWLIFYLSDTKVDFYEHIKNGSIIWIFLTMLVMGNFKLLVNRQYKNGLAQKLIIAFIIIFMLIMLGIYLILNFTTYGLMKTSLVESNTSFLVILLGVSTIILNILRIVFF
jgi:hypothetical protein